MKNFLNLNKLKLFALTAIFLVASIHGEEDDLSPETLPDEIPTEQSFSGPSETENSTEISARDVNSNAAPAAEAPQPVDEDAELDKPITPLFPTQPEDLSIEPHSSAKKAELEEDLSQPDPSYIPPPPAPKPIPVVAPIVPEPVKPKVTVASPPSEPIKSSPPPQPKVMPRPNMVWAPEILRQMLSDPSHLVPVETYISRLAVPVTSPSRPPKGVSDFSIILSNNEFYPSKIVLRSGSSVRLLFTTTNKKSAALIIEKLNIQRWVASRDSNEKIKETDKSKFEVTRELNANRITEIELQPKPGVYSFHDVMTGASGEISVEEP